MFFVPMMLVGTGGFVDQLCVSIGGKDSKLKSTSCSFLLTMVGWRVYPVGGDLRRNHSVHQNLQIRMICFLYWVSSQMTFRVKEWYSFQMYVFSTYLKFGYCLVLIPQIH